MSGKRRPPYPDMRPGRAGPSLLKTVPDTDGTRPPVEQHSACLVVIKGDKVGLKYDLDRELSVGREPSCGIYLDDGLVSRNHAKFTPEGAGVRLTDLRSTNGTYVNDDAVDSRYLNHNDQVTIGQTIFKFISSNNIEAAYADHVYSLTRFDGLTGIHNRASFDAEIQGALTMAGQGAGDLSLMLFDIDHFKRCNDTYGHRAGDYVLKQVAMTVAQNARQGDFVARYGGEEFVILIKSLPWPGPPRFADHLRGLIQAQRFEFEGQHIPITISAGVAMWEAQLHSPARLLELADQRLYRAKGAGRNCIVAT